MGFFGTLLWVFMGTGVVIGLIWRAVNKECHDKFRKEAPGAILTWMLRRLK